MLQYEAMTWLGYALISALFSGLASIFEKRTLNRLHSIDFSAAIAFTTALITLPILFTSSWEKITPLTLLIMFAISLFAAWAFISVTRGIRHMEISLSSPLFLLGPLITTLLAFILLGERISALQVTGMVILLLGTYILETTHFMKVGEFWNNIWRNKYTQYILLGLVLYAFTAIGDRIVLGKFGVPAALELAIVQCFIAVEFLFLTWHYRGSPIASLRLVQTHWKSIILLALLMITYRYFHALAIALAAAGLVTAIKRSTSLFSTVIGGSLFHDHGIWRKTTACLIMLIGVYMIAI